MRRIPLRFEYPSLQNACRACIGGIAHDTDARFTDLAIELRGDLLAVLNGAVALIWRSRLSPMLICEDRACIWCENPNAWHRAIGAWHSPYLNPWVNDIVDGRTVETGTLVKCEVCIIGAGPAGLAIANELLGQDFRVCVLESGGFESDAATQLLGNSEVEVNDDLYPNTLYAHDRQIGGTSAQWDVMIDGKRHMHVALLDPIDFRRRPWRPYSGSPIDHFLLSPYYERAQAMCGAGRSEYRPDSWSDEDGKPFAFESGRVASKMVSASPRKMFQQTLPERLRASRNVSVLSWSNATELEVTSDASIVTGVKVACLNGNRFRIAACIVILAQGGFEVPRLLLASNSIARAGLGNEHDLVGRFLMDRQIVKAGTLVPTCPGGLRRFGFYDMRNMLGSHVLGKLTLTEKTLEAEQILNSLVSFSPREHR